MSKERSPGFSGKNSGVTPSVAAPGISHPSDVTVTTTKMFTDLRHRMTGTTTATTTTTQRNTKPPHAIAISSSVHQTQSNNVKCSPACRSLPRTNETEDRGRDVLEDSDSCTELVDR